MWVLYLLGIVIGTYIISLVLESIDNSKSHKKFLEDMENFNKK